MEAEPGRKIASPEAHSRTLFKDRGQAGKGAAEDSPFVLAKRALWVRPPMTAPARIAAGALSRKLGIPRQGVEPCLSGCAS